MVCVNTIHWEQETNSIRVTYLCVNIELCMKTIFSNRNKRHSKKWIFWRYKKGPWMIKFSSYRVSNCMNDSDRCKIANRSFRECIMLLWMAKERNFRDKRLEWWPQRWTLMLNETLAKQSRVRCENTFVRWVCIEGLINICERKWRKDNRNGDDAKMSVKGIFLQR